MVRSARLRSRHRGSITPGQALVTPLFLAIFALAALVSWVTDGPSLGSIAIGSGLAAFIVGALLGPRLAPWEAKVGVVAQEQLVKAADELRAKEQALEKRYRLSGASCDVDAREGVARMTLPDGRLLAADCVVAGTNDAGGRWRWSWAMEGEDARLRDPQREKALRKRVRRLAGELGFVALKVDAFTGATGDGFNGTVMSHVARMTVAKASIALCVRDMAAEGVHQWERNAGDRSSYVVVLILLRIRETTSAAAPARVASGLAHQL